jgi:nitrogen fixation NifU-like protein
MDLYAENILDHYRHPRQKELLTSLTVAHEERNLSCGDSLRVELHIGNGVITSIGWQGDGCAISQAGMSMLAEELMGKTTGDIEALTKNDILKMLGVEIGPRRLKCALLSLLTIKNALCSLQKRAPMGWKDIVDD